MIARLAAFVILMKSLIIKNIYLGLQIPISNTIANVQAGERNSFSNINVLLHISMPCQDQSFKIVLFQFDSGSERCHVSINTLEVLTLYVNILITNYAVQRSWASYLFDVTFYS